MDLMDEYKGKLDIKAAKAIIADHYDVYLKKENMCSRTVCSHYDLDPRKYMSQATRPLPFAPHGAVDGMVCDSKMAAKMSFAGIWGNSCGTPFITDEFIQKNRQWTRFQPYLRDRLTQPWTVFMVDDKDGEKDLELENDNEEDLELENEGEKNLDLQNEGEEDEILDDDKEKELENEGEQDEIFDDDKEEELEENKDAKETTKQGKDTKETDYTEGDNSEPVDLEKYKREKEEAEKNVMKGGGVHGRKSIKRKPMKLHRSKRRK